MRNRCRHTWLAGAGSDPEGSRSAVGDERIVDMIDQQVVMRTAYVMGNLAPVRNRHEDRHRQHVGFRRKDGCFQGLEIWRRRREEVDWKRRGRNEVEVRECDERPIHIRGFFSRRRRHVIVDKGKGRRRLECNGEQCEASPSIAPMQAMRVAAQIGPVSFRGIDQAGAPPSKRFPPDRRNGAHPLRQRIVRVGGQKFLIPLQGVALERQKVGVLLANSAIRRACTVAFVPKQLAHPASVRRTKGAVIFDALHGSCAP